MKLHKSFRNAIYQYGLSGGQINIPHTVNRHAVRAFGNKQGFARERSV